jgi:hypothetical protein
MANIWQTGMRKEGSFWEGVHPAVYSWDNHPHHANCMTWQEDTLAGGGTPNPNTPITAPLNFISYSGDWSNGTLVVRWQIHNETVDERAIKAAFDRQGVTPNPGIIAPPAPNFGMVQNPDGSFSQVFLGWTYNSVTFSETLSSTDEFTQINSDTVEYKVLMTLTYDDDSFATTGFQMSRYLTLQIPLKP